MFPPVPQVFLSFFPMFTSSPPFPPGFHQVSRPGGDLGRPQHADHGGAALQERGAVGAAGRAQGVWTGKVGVQPV